jgi:streptomycin 6-kinase
MEGLHEIAALRILDGDPTVRLIDADDDLNAMLLERCDPGTPLRSLFQPDQDVIIAGLLKRFWRVLDEPHPFRPLSAMINHWISATRRDEPRWHDRGLVRDGLKAFETLIATSFSSVLLATDLHAGNVLAAKREPWLVIDPKPFVGESAYDATQHLLNSRARLRFNAKDTIRRVSDLFEVDYDRVRLWMFARLAAEPRDNWDDELSDLARLLMR